MTASPPITEIGFTIIFEPINGLTVLDIAELYHCFEAEYPVLQQVPPLQAAPLEAPFRGNSFGPTIQIVSPTIELPRIWFIAADSKNLIQFQSDRFAHNWRRLTPLDVASDYPGYFSTRDRFLAEYNHFERWAQQKFGGAPKPIMGELLYVNTVLLGPPAEQTRLSAVFRKYKPTSIKKILGFQMTWREFVTEGANDVIDVAAAGGAIPDGSPAATLTMNARFDLNNTGRSIQSDRFDMVHAKVHEIFAENIEETFRGATP
jgi:uncharacterized protein (TIGR04255 family)